MSGSNVMPEPTLVRRQVSLGGNAQYTMIIAAALAFVIVLVIIIVVVTKKNKSEDGDDVVGQTVVVDEDGTEYVADVVQAAPAAGVSAYEDSSDPASSVPGFIFAADRNVQDAKTFWVKEDRSAPGALYSRKGCYKLSFAPGVYKTNYVYPPDKPYSVTARRVDGGNATYLTGEPPSDSYMGKAFDTVCV